MALYGGDLHRRLRCAVIDFVTTLRGFNISLHVVLDSPPNSAPQADTRKLPELKRRMQESLTKDEHLMSLTKWVVFSSQQGFLSA